MAEAARNGTLRERFPAVERLEARNGRRSIPYVQQTSATSCGAACLAMTLGFHGRRARLDEVLERMQTGRDGTTMRQILDAAESFGLRGRAVRLDLPDVGYLVQGSILHWRMAHFVVLDRITPKGVWVVDPARGRHLVPEEEFGRLFTGIALMLEPTATFEPGVRGPSRVRHYLRHILTHSGTLTRILVTSLFAQAVALTLPLLTGAVVDRVVPRGDADLLAVILGGIAMVVVFSFLIAFVRAHLFLHLRTNLDLRMTLDFVDHLMRLPFSFFQVRQTGDLLMRLNSNAIIRETLTNATLSAILDGMMVLLYLVILLVTHVGLGLLTVGLGLLRVGIYIVSRRRYRELMTEYLQAQAESSNYQVQMIAGIESLKAAGVEHRAVEHWSNLLVDVMNVSIRRARLAAVVESTLGAVGTASPLLLLGYGAWLVLGGQLTLGTMLAMSALAVGFLNPLSKLVGVALQLQTLGSYVERVDDVLEKEPEQSDPGAVPAPQFTGDIELRNVSFRYSDAAPWAVHEVSVHIDAGSQVAIVGPSGSGKSTLARLLVALYRPDAGRILYDGEDVTTFRLGTVRRQIGFVPQAPFIFASSIRENIAITRPDADLEEIRKAAGTAYLDHEVEILPLKYSTPVSSGGASLSGGQRQRLALARAILGNPRILVLDESTSHLDARAETRIHENLRSLRSTRILIAHRLSTVVDADQILVMDAGRIVERGRHSDLLRHDGVYAELFRSQAREGGA